MARCILWCVLCLSGPHLVWQPAWTVVVSAFESLVTLIALILSMGLRTLTISDTTFGGTASFVSPAEIFNFLLSGAVAYLSWTRGMQELFRR